jgi:alcohol dehydrogenase class IV
VQELGRGRAFILCGRHFDASPLNAELIGVLRDRYVGSFVSTAPQGSPHELRAATEAIANAGADVLIAIGGGSVLGVAKCAAHALLNPDSFEPYADRFAFDRTAVNAALGGDVPPIIALPTNAGSGSEMNQYGAVTNSHTREKIRVADHRLQPRVVILDPVLTISLGGPQTCWTGANALSHCFEATYSRAKHPVSTALARQAAALMAKALPICVREPENLAARQDQLIASAMSSLAFSNSMLGLNAAFGHSLGLVGDIPVALGNYIMLPISLRFNASHASADILEIAVAMGLADPSGKVTQMAAESAADRVGQWLYSLAGNVRLRDVLKGEEVLRTTAEHMLMDVCLPYNPRPINDFASILGLLQVAW